MKHYYQQKLSPSEKQVYMESNVFKWGWFARIDPKKWLKHATRRDMRGDSVYLEGFKMETHHPDYVFCVPNFGS